MRRHVRIARKLAWSPRQPQIGGLDVFVDGLRVDVLPQQVGGPSRLPQRGRKKLVGGAGERLDEETVKLGEAV
jgi:hypothetical protein